MAWSALHGTLLVSILAASCAGACTGAVSSASGANGGFSSGMAGGSAAANTGGSSGGSTLAAGALASVARRLSRAEFDNVLKDVLGDSTNPAERFLLEDEYAPYDNDYTLQNASQALIDGLNALAEDVAKRALADPARRAALVTCSPSGPGDAACFRTVIETLGARLFRRPLAATEVESYLALQQFATENNPALSHDFYTAVELFLRSVLQDPEFLYRIEVGTPTGNAGEARLDDFEIATRLSFLVSGSTPDDALLAQARSGELSVPATRRASAARLLATDSARAQLHRYHAMWLGYRTIPQAPALARAFDSETTALIDRVVFDGTRSYLELFTSPETYLDNTLADHYGLPHPAGGQGWVAYGSSGRAGVLAHGSVLSAFSKFSDTSPTQRGILVRTRLLCQDVPPPPANVNVDQPPGDGQAVCKADRYAQHRASTSCAACHNLMDPIGFGLEKFDMAGRFREHDDGLPNCPIDGVGELPGYGTFSGPAELGQKLVQSNVLDACSVRQYLTFAAGRRLRPDEQATVDGAVDQFRKSGHAFSEVVLDFVASPAFALRREPTP